MNARIVLICAFAVIASCGGGGGSGPAVPSSPTHFLYASTFKQSSNEITGIYAFGVDAGGVLTPVSGSPFSPTSGGSIAISRDSKFLYIADVPTGKIAAFSINSDGSLSPVPGGPFAVPETPSFILASPTADFLYAISGLPATVMAFAIDSATGAPSQTSSVQVTDDVRGATITPDGRYLYVDSFGGPSELTGYSLNAVTGALSLVPGSPLDVTQVFGFGFDAGSVIVDPTGKYLYAGNQYVGKFDSQCCVVAFSIDAASGLLRLIPGPRGSMFDLGGSYGAGQFAASGRFLIADISASGVAGQCALAVLSIDPATGALASPDPPFGSICGRVAADPSGAWVYVGGDWNDAGRGVLVYLVDQATGALTHLGEAPLPGMGVISMALTH
jgi:6-phosphogluconolactonase (cycloisomerase 2 family)